MAESAPAEDDANVVYDSQEELDQWPDSQPPEPEPEPQVIETAHDARSSGKLQVILMEKHFSYMTVIADSHDPGRCNCETRFQPAL
jgi:hypothetical protein